MQQLRLPCWYARSEGYSAVETMQKGKYLANASVADTNYWAKKLPACEILYNQKRPAASTTGLSINRQSIRRDSLTKPTS